MGFGVGGGDMLIIFVLMIQAAAALGGAIYAVLVGARMFQARAASAKVYGLFYLSAFLVVLTVIYLARIVAELPHA